MYSFRKKMIPVFIVPTGLGADIGGHAGDASPAAKLIASISDILITHPNVVNASDINEMTENMLYVEGSILDRFLENNIQLEPTFFNKILLAVNSPIDIDIINAVSAARATIGADIEIMELKKSLIMKATKKADGSASGIVKGCKSLIEQSNDYKFDALAISSEIKITKSAVFDYISHGGVNPWGAVEAKASKFIANRINKPVAHSPYNPPETWSFFDKYRLIVDPRMAAECVSVCYLHCILKGLHKAPRIGKGLSASEISCLITPVGCYGRPHKACEKLGIPIIAVQENKIFCQERKLPKNTIYADTYLEAAGIIAAMKAGINIKSVSRPLEKTRVNKFIMERKLSVAK